MIKITTTITALIILLLNCAPSSNQETLQQLQLIEDKMALKTLVDEFSNLADVKDVEAQLLLFTEDAVVQSSSNGNMGSVFNGREEIGDAFSGFLANFETVYHINGQQTVEINGTNATGIAYCLVVLISENEGIRENELWVFVIMMNM